MRPNAPRPVPLAETKLSVDAVVAAAQGTRMPGAVTRVEWPTDRKPVWKVSLDGAQASVGIEDATGVAKVDPARPEDTARLMRRVYDGTRMGLPWQIVIFPGGMVPAILAVTGIIMWWRAGVEGALARTAGGADIIRPTPWRITAPAVPAPAPRSAPASRRWGRVPPWRAPPPP